MKMITKRNDFILETERNRSMMREDALAMAMAESAKLWNDTCAAHEAYKFLRWAKYKSVLPDNLHNKFRYFSNKHIYEWIKKKRKECKTLYIQNCITPGERTKISTVEPYPDFSIRRKSEWTKEWKNMVLMRYVDNQLYYLHILQRSNHQPSVIELQDPIEFV